METLFETYMKFINEESDDESSKETKQEEQKSEKKITADSLVKDAMVLEPSAALKFVSQQFGDKSGKEFLSKHLMKFSEYVVKNGWYKAKDLGKSIKDFADKNIEDNSDIDFSKVDIDEDVMKTVYVIDGDCVKSLEKYAEDWKKEAEGAVEEAEKASDQLKNDVKKAGVKIDDEKLSDNAIAVAGAIDNGDNKGKSKEEMTEEVNAAIDKEKEVAALEKKMKESEKMQHKLDNIKGLPEVDEKKAEAGEYDSKEKEDNKEAEGDVDAVRKKLDSSLKGKLGKDYKSSLETGIFKTDDFKKVIEKKIPKIVIDAIKEPYTISTRIDFFNDEAKDVVEASDSGYKVRLLSDNEKNEGLNKIQKTFKDIIKSSVGNDKKLGKKTYAYYKYWNGDNPDGNFDSVFVFVGYLGNKTNESMNESLLNESKPTPDEAFAMLAKFMKEHPDDEVLQRSLKVKSFPSSIMKNLLKQNGYKMGTMQKDQYVKYLDTLMRKNGGFTKDNFDSFIEDKGITAKDSAKFVTKAIKWKEPSNVEIGQAADAQDLVDRASDNAGDVASSSASSDNIESAVKKVASGAIPVDEKGNVFSPSNMLQRINKFDDFLDDGKLDASEFKQIGQFQDQLADYQEWAMEHANSTDPDVQAKVAQINMVAKKFNEFVAENDNEILNAEGGNAAASVAKRIPGAADNGKQVAGLAKSEEAKGFWAKLGGKATKALHAFGAAVAVAKIAKFCLNHGKSFTDALGSQYVKFKEDKDVIAQIKILLNNGEDSDSQNADTNFGIRFSINDLKWHATNLDNRKMKIKDEDTLIKRVMETSKAKEFKKKCIDNWSKVFLDKDSAIVYTLKNYKKLGIEINDKGLKKFIPTMISIADNFEEIKKQFA